MIIEDVDLTLRSNLDFSSSLAIKENVFWRLDCGLGKDFSNPSMCETILKGLLHFFTFAMDNFEKKTAGISLYKGEYARFIEYANLLKNMFHSLPDVYPLVVEITDTDLTYEQIIHLHELKVFMHPLKFSFQHTKIATDFSLDPSFKKSKIALLVEKKASVKDIVKIVQAMDEKTVRLIPEKLFAMEWDELDCIYANKAFLDIDTQRLLEGFSVTGVEIKEIDKKFAL